MGKLKLTIGLLVVCCLIYAQQDAQSVAKQINQIKLQPDVYLSEEATCLDWNEALANAKDMLAIKIREWAKVNKKDSSDVIVAVAQQHTMEIKTKRGDLHRAFVYVKIDDVLSVNIDESQSESIAHSSAVESKKNGLTENNELVKSNADKASMNMTSVPIASDVKVIKADAPRLNAIESRMIQVKDGNGIKEFVSSTELKNQIVQYGKFSNMPADIDCYLFVYNRDRQVVHYLRKKGSAYYDVQNGQVVDMNTLKGMGAIWFQVKN